MRCIFGSANQWATNYAIAPAQMKRMHQYEQDFGHTLDNRWSIPKMAAKCKPYGTISGTLLTNYSILILNNSISTVNAQPAVQIQAALDNLMRQKTCITFVVAQRISTVHNADRILPMDKGRLVGQGTHTELMRTSPLYGAILESQVKQAPSLTPSR